MVWNEIDPGVFCADSPVGEWTIWQEDCGFWDAQPPLGVTENLVRFRDRSKFEDQIQHAIRETLKQRAEERRVAESQEYQDWVRGYERV